MRRGSSFARLRSVNTGTPADSISAETRPGPEASDHGHVPVPVQPLDELEDLLLGSPDVQLVDDEEHTRAPLHV